MTPRTHRLAKQNSVRFDELADINLVLLDLPFTSQYLRGLIDGHDIDPTIVATASSTEMVRGLVGAGVGCSILAMRPVIDRTYGGDQVVAVPIRTPLAPLRLALGYLGDKPRRIVQAFKVACLDYFAQPAAQKLISPK